MFLPGIESAMSRSTFPSWEGTDLTATFGMERRDGRLVLVLDDIHVM